MIQEQVPQPGTPDWEGQVVRLLGVMLDELNRKAERSTGGAVVVQLRGAGDVLQVYVGGSLVGAVRWNGTALVLV